MRTIRDKKVKEMRIIQTITLVIAMFSLSGCLRYEEQTLPNLSEEIELQSDEVLVSIDVSELNFLVNTQSIDTRAAIYSDRESNLKNTYALVFDNSGATSADSEKLFLQVQPVFRSNNKYYAIFKEHSTAVVMCGLGNVPDELKNYILSASSTFSLADFKAIIDKEQYYYKPSESSSKILQSSNDAILPTYIATKELANISTATLSDVELSNHFGYSRIDLDLEGTGYEIVEVMTSNAPQLPGSAVRVEQGHIITNSSSTNTETIESSQIFRGLYSYPTQSIYGATGVPLNRDEAVSVVFGARKSGTSGSARYYRVLLRYTDSGLTSYDLEAGTRYNVSISHINSEGYPTASEAIVAPPGNIDYDVTVDASASAVKTNGQYYLGVSRTSVRLPDSYYTDRVSELYFTGLEVSFGSDANPDTDFNFNDVEREMTYSEGVTLTSPVSDWEDITLSENSYKKTLNFSFDPTKANVRGEFIVTFRVGELTQEVAFRLPPDIKLIGNPESTLTAEDDAMATGVFHIYTARGLKAFADLVNGTANNSAAAVCYGFGEANFKEVGEAQFSSVAATSKLHYGYRAISAYLQRDIDLGEVSGATAGESNTKLNWTPIGNHYYNGGLLNHSFTGKFYGEGKVISNLYYDNTTTLYASGLFGGVTDAVIENFTLSNYNVVANNSTGGVVGQATRVNIKSITINAGEVKGNLRIAGVVGSMLTGNLSDITINEGANITGVENAGGVLGYSEVSANLSNCVNYTDGIYTSYRYSGGIAGNCRNYVLIDNCHNYGDVESVLRAGGIVARIEGASSAITDCTSSGTILSNRTYSGSGDGGGDVGGIVAAVYGGTVMNCSTSGIVKSNGDFAGGIVGARYYGSVRNCTSTATVSGFSAGQIVGYGGQG